MPKSKLLADETYDKQIDRMKALAKFPEVGPARQELRRALRRITESDLDFLKRLITDVVDTHRICPSPAEMIQLAGAKRAQAHVSVGSPNCEHCGGSGFVSVKRMVEIPGIVPYEGDFAAVCACRGKR